MDLELRVALLESVLRLLHPEVFGPAEEDLSGRVTRHATALGPLRVVSGDGTVLAPVGGQSSVRQLRPSR